MTRFTSERRVFDRLKADCSSAAQGEYEEAIATLLERYNTTIYENRFVVGGAVEVLTYALLRSVGIDCMLYSDQASGGDILLPRDRKLSIKGSFRGIASVKLLNKMGDGSREWDTATFFIVSGTGIVFGAPNMVDPGNIRDTGDGTMLTVDGLRRLIGDADNVIPMKIARKPPTEMTGFSHKASAAVARQILSDTGAGTLLGAFPSV